MYCIDKGNKNTRNIVPSIEKIEKYDDIFEKNSTILFDR